MTINSLISTLEKRSFLTKRLALALAHLPVSQQVDIVASFIALDKLEEIVVFQERKL